MRNLAIVFCVVVLGFLSREADAQSFFYVPSGYDLGYTYGLDFGNGVGFGYGAAVGVPLTMQQLGSSYTPPVQSPQSWFDSGESFEQHQGADLQVAIATAVPKKPVKTVTPKNSVAKAKPVKSNHQGVGQPAAKK